jgi:hypothetical protein
MGRLEARATAAQESRICLSAKPPGGAGPKHKDARDENMKVLEG